MKIIATGLSGLVGSRIKELLPFEFEEISRANGIDVLNSEKIQSFFSASDAPIVFHLAGKADVDGCEKDKDLKENGQAWKMNVLGTQNIIDACKKTGKKIVYISTDFAFDGTKQEYSEDDIPNPINWYAVTKIEGEKIVQNSQIPYLILRIAYPYRARFDKKTDFMRAMKSRLEQNMETAAITDHVFTPTFIDDIAHAFSVLIEKNAIGVYHVVGSQSLSPYDAAILIAKEFGFNPSFIKPVLLQEFFKDRAPRPFHLKLRNDKITQLGVHMRSFEEGLQEIKKQL